MRASTMNGYRALAFIGVLLLMAGCLTAQDTGDPAVDDYANAVKSIGAACDVYSGALEQVTIMRNLGQLSSGERAEVTRIREEVKPICEVDDPPLSLSDGRSALDFVKAMTARLLIYQGDPI